MTRTKNQNPVTIRIRKAKLRGQSFVELAIFLPIILILLSGLVEIGFLLNDYITILGAARNAARFVSDGSIHIRDNEDYCLGDGAGIDATTDFYRQAHCLACLELEFSRPGINDNYPDGGDQFLKLPYGQLPQDQLNMGIPPPDWYDCPLDSTQDDVVVTAMSVISNPGGATVKALPTDLGGYASLYGRQIPRITTAEIVDITQPGTPNTGYVVVEIFYHYNHRLGLPWIQVFIPDPVLMHAYTIMPLGSAKPTATPIP